MFSPIRKDTVESGMNLQDLDGLSLSQVVRVLQLISWILISLIKSKIIRKLADKATRLVAITNKP